jgi:hypothetical protein
MTKTMSKATQKCQGQYKTKFKPKTRTNYKAYPRTKTTTQACQDNHNKRQRHKAIKDIYKHKNDGKARLETKTTQRQTKTRKYKGQGKTGQDYKTGKTHNTITQDQTRHGKKTTQREDDNKTQYETIQDKATRHNTKARQTRENRKQ